ncbi:MAG TPA: hypothetical protein VFT55_17305, partial [Planctomycetota bacterium]|nr:hypothetical protein [Planctomycetota bacterium]
TDTSPEPVLFQLQDLRAEVDRLRARVEALELGAAPERTASAVGSSVAAAEDSGSWLRQSGALRQLATISFVLVIALVLRTLADGGVLDASLGVWLGIGYAGLLMLVGWQRFAADRPGKRVFTLCGALLLCSLVLETHSRFAWLSAPVSHGLLLAGLAVSTVLGLRYRSPIVVELGVFGSATTTLALGFPLPEFRLTAATLLLAMIAESSVRRPRSGWLPWLLLLEIAFLWLLWAMKLRTALARDAPVDATLQLDSYAPALAATFAVLLWLAIVRARRQPGAFAFVLPTATVALAMAAAAAVLVPWLCTERWLGAVALGFAAVHALVAACLRRAGRAAVAFVLAALAAFVPGVWLAAANWWVALAATSAAALALGAASRSLASGGLRAVALGMQVAVLAVAVTGGAFDLPPTEPWPAVALAAVLASMASAHARWTRVVPPPGSLRAWLWPQDGPAHILSWCAIAALFVALRTALWLAVAAFAIDVPDAFAAGQSVLLASIAIAMLVVARWRRDRATLRDAIGVAAIAGAKVFASDLVALHGVPRVLCVFSFGVLAAVGSVVLGRWQSAGVGSRN